jgi:hypothetical protein
MNRLRTLALAAAPTALLIGLAAPAPAADAPAPMTQTAQTAPMTPAAPMVPMAQTGPMAQTAPTQSLAQSLTQAAPAAASSTCNIPTANQVLTALEGVQLKQCIAAQPLIKSWHWMGNYGSVYDVAAAANGGGIGAGELLTQNINGLYATFMFY